MGITCNDSCCFADLLVLSFITNNGIRCEIVCMLTTKFHRCVLHDRIMECVRLCLDSYRTAIQLSKCGKIIIFLIIFFENNEMVDRLMKTLQSNVTIILHDTFF